MNKNEPVDPRVRLAIARWSDDAPRGSVTSFCAEHGLSRKTFYALRARARDEGPAAVLEPKSRRPKTSPARIDDHLRQQAVDVRAALERSGLDHGPISVFEKMRAMGIEPPSVASLARIFRAEGVARLEPKKKPRAAYRRFVYPAPNACWQLDATEYVLSGGRTCVIFQLEDDHSRLAIASHVAVGETSDAALEVVRKGITTHGVPQRLLTDNGIALNPSRRGWQGQLVRYVTSLGVTAITGKPYKPTTQGKNERFHQTLFRFLDKQPLAATITELQAQVDAFDQIYNTERPHQSLPGRITPQQAWNATPVAEPPRPAQPITGPVTAPLKQPLRGRTADAQHGDEIRTVLANGTVNIRGIRFQITSTLAGKTVHVIWTPDHVRAFDQQGTLLIEHPWPTHPVAYVGNGQPRGPRPKHRETAKPSPKS